VEQVIGTFARPLVVRTVLTPNLSFRQALARVKHACIDTYAHQDVSPLTASMMKNRHGVPISLVSFQLHNQVRCQWTLHGVTATVIATSPPAGEVSPLGQIVLELEQTEDGLQGPLVYAAAQVSDRDIGRFLAHFQALLQQAVDNGDAIAV
jgi:hypothetical protein